MSAHKLSPRLVERVWGCFDLPAWSGATPGRGERIGEIWFTDEADGEAELLVKFLFTSDKLSVQVHPDDESAASRGHARGKDEAWFVLNAEEKARIGIGLRQPLSAEALRSAALDGRLEDLLDWRMVSAGDFFYVPGGTIHAIGAGLSLVEIQQNVDLTYRLYDYGRPRELHLEQAVAVAHPEPYRAAAPCRPISDRRSLLVEGGPFTVERWTGSLAGRLQTPGLAELLVVPLGGHAAFNGSEMTAGSVWSLREGGTFSADRHWDGLVAYSGPYVDVIR